MSIHEIRVTSETGDPLAHDVAAEARRSLGVVFGNVTTSQVYRVEGTDLEGATTLAAGLFADSITQTYTIDEPPADPESAIVEIGYKPGVMNPAVASIMRAAEDLGVPLEAADASIEYRFYGASPGDVHQTVGRLLMNPTVERIVTGKPDTLRFEGTVGPIETVPIRNATREELAELSRDKLFLSDEEMTVVQDHFRKLDRDPTDAELEHIAAVSFSEHCGHKTFKAKVLVRQEDGSYIEKPPLMSRITTGAKEQPAFERLVVSAFGDNSGVMKFYDGQAICGKVETHNSPSAIEPYGGAMTGSGGVFRDIMGTGQGAKTIISTDMFCFAPPDTDPSTLPAGTLNPDYLQRRVVQGVRDYGNRMGIPTANGSVHYHPDFRAKPTVIVGAYGILPEVMAEKGQPQVGDRVLIIGGKTGRDGIHGATFSSGEMSEKTAQVNAGAVQIGNAIEEKRMFDALLEARDTGLIRAMTDCGAAGFGSAIGEMGEQIGVTVDISKAPLKYPGLAPWEIWISESQERMVSAIAPEDVEAFLAICRKYNVEAVDIGEFDGSKTLTVNYGQQNVIELDYDFLNNGLPQRTMYAHWEQPAVEEVRPTAPKDSTEWVDRLKAVLAHGNVCSKEPIIRQYDHGVQGGNCVSPYGGKTQEAPNDALVIRPMLDKPYGVVQSHGMNPILNRLDPYKGTVWAITEAAANYVAVGGDINEATAVGNYIWPFPDEESMGSLDRSVDAAVDMMHVLGVPVISGKDSLSSTYRNGDTVIKIPPVYTASIFGRIPDVEKTSTANVKKPGESLLFLVGTPSDNMGGSTYYDVTEGQSIKVPEIDTTALPATLDAVTRAIQQGAILSCHDISEGGLVTAVSEMCFGDDRAGAVISAPKDGDLESFLFSETAGCFVVELSSAEVADFIFDDVPHRRIGFTTKDGSLQVNNSTKVFDVTIDELKTAWQKPMKEVFHS